MPDPRSLEILQAVDLATVDRISASLEGDWSPHAVDIWKRGLGLAGLSRVVRSHPIHRPSLELHMGPVWLGIPCFTRSDGDNLFDEELAREIVRRVEKAQPGTHS